MSLMTLARPAALVLVLAAPAAAQIDRRTAGTTQSPVTTSDIQRLQDQVFDASNEVARMRSRDQAGADRLQTRLDDLRDDVVYFRVKMRREGSVPRNDFEDVRSQLEGVRAEARGVMNNNTGSYSGSGSGTWSTSPAGTGGQPTGTVGQTTTSRRNEVPSGTELDVRLDRQLSSDIAQVEDRFTATTVADLYQGNTVLIPAGSSLRGVVSSVQKASRTERKGSLTVAFDQISINGRSYPIHGTVTQAIESEGIRGEAAKIGAGAGVGAIIGGIIGGAKGALLGVLIGGGGTIAATEGKDVTLPPGTVLRVRFDQALQVR